MLIPGISGLDRAAALKKSLPGLNRREQRRNRLPAIVRTPLEAVSTSARRALDAPAVRGGDR